MLRGGLPACGLRQRVVRRLVQGASGGALLQKNHSTCYMRSHFQFMPFHGAYSRTRLSETDGYVVVNLTVVAIPSILLCDEMRTPVLQMI